ncbi:MAG: ATP-dependent zinc metalloprotease FtsH [Polyangiales bacterium]
MAERDDSSRRPPKRTPPRDEERNEGDGPNDRKLQAAMTIAMLVTLGMLAVHHLSSAAQTKPYYEFKQRVRENRVEEVFLGEGRIRWKLRPEPVPVAAPAANANPTAPATPRRVTPADTRMRTYETLRVEDPQLVPLLESQHVRFSGMPENGPLVTLMTYGILIMGAMMLWRALARRLQGQAGGVLAFGKSKGKVFEESEVTVRFDDVAGVEEAKEELREVVEFLKSPEKFTRIGAKIPKGVLLVGPPGTGKTLLARAVAGEASVPFYSISGSEFVEMFVGVGAARVRDLFENAQSHAPCIVFIDELDALGRSRGSNVLGTNEEREQTLNQLLVEMDGFEANKGVIILAATNRPEILDPALLRPGRFDRQVLVDRPDKKGREAILKVHVKGVPLAPDVDLGEIAQRTPGFAGADLANLINESALLAARKGFTEVHRAEIEEAVERVSAGLERKSRIIAPKERTRVAYHEVGHAIVGEVVPGGDKVVKISIVPRGIAALGYTMKLPTEDRYLMTESELQAQLATLLGGRVAERVVFGEVSTGAGNDLQRATDLARAMVVDYGMSPAIGPVTLGHERATFLDGPGEHRAMREHGDRLADLIDNEVKRLVEAAEHAATEILQARRDTLEHVAAALMEKEYLDGDEFRRLLQGEAPPPVEPTATAAE